MVHMAAYNGHAQIIRFLIGLPEIDVNAVCKEKDTPLHKACYNGHAEVVKMLLAAGARPNACTPVVMCRNTTGCMHHAGRMEKQGQRTPMHYCVFRYCILCVCVVVFVSRFLWVYNSMCIYLYAYIHNGETGQRTSVHYCVFGY